MVQIILMFMANTKLLTFTKKRQTVKLKPIRRGDHRPISPQFPTLTSWPEGKRSNFSIDVCLSETFGCPQVSSVIVQSFVVLIIFQMLWFSRMPYVILVSWITQRDALAAVDLATPHEYNIRFPWHISQISSYARYSVDTGLIDFQVYFQGELWLASLFNSFHALPIAKLHQPNRVPTLLMPEPSIEL